MSRTRSAAKFAEQGMVFARNWRAGCVILSAVYSRSEESGVSSRHALSNEHGLKPDASEYLSMTLTMREFVEETPNDKPEQNVRMNFLPFFGLFVSLGIAAITFVWIMIAPSFSDPMAPLTSAIMSVFLNGVAFLIWIASVLGESAKKKENRTIFGNTVFIVLSLFLYIYWVCLLTGMNGFRYGFNGFH